MSEYFDVIIAGGAALGSSTAYHLLNDPDFDGRVLVLEKDASYRLSASALSAASIRQQFSVPANIWISLYGIQFMRRIGEHLGVDDVTPDIALHEGGYLYCATEAGAAQLSDNVALQNREGADIVYLQSPALKAQFPWLNTNDLTAGSWGRTGEGWYDGWSLLQAFRRKAIALGAVYREQRAIRLVREGNRITGVVLNDGSTIACRSFVNCAGSGARALAATAGIDIPVHAKRRSVFSFTCATPVPDCPLLIDISGAYVRPEGAGFICGISPTSTEPDSDWQDDNPATQNPDWSLFEERIWPALAHRIPAFENIRPGRAWAGPYDMNLFDQNAIVGPADDVGNMFLCNGFSGHGLQQSPAVGRALSELIVHGAFKTLDLRDLAYGRITADRPLREANII